MNKFRKIIVWIICICMLLSIFATAKFTAFGAESADFDSFNDYGDATSEYNYYQFENIIDIQKSDDFIVVTQLLKAGTDQETKEYVVFDTKGEFLDAFEMNSTIGDVQKIQLYYNTAVSLNYNNDLSMLYSNMITDYALTYVGEYFSMQNETNTPILRDFAICGDYLYYIKIATADSLKSVKLSGGKTVAQITTAEADVEVGSLSGFSAVESCGDDLLIQVRYSDIYHYDTTSKKTTLLEGVPSEEIIQFGGYNNHVFLLTSKGIYYCDITLSDTFELALETSNESSVTSNIVDPVSFAVSYENDLVKVLVADNKGAMAIKGFTLSSGKLLTDMFSIYSFSSSEEGYNTPTDISSSYDLYVVADSGNNRVKIIDKKGNIDIIETTDESGNTITPVYAGLDYQENLYVISDRNDLYVYSSSGKLQNMIEDFEGSQFSNVRGLEVSPFDNTCYFVSGKNIYQYDHATGELTCPVQITTSGTGIAIDYFNNYVGVYDINSIDVYSLSTGKHIYEVAKMNIYGYLQDVQFDLEGNIYALNSNSSGSIVSKYIIADEDSKNYEKGEIIFERIAVSTFEDDGNENFAMMTINFEEELAYLIKDGEHRVYESVRLFDNLEVCYNLELDIPSDIFEQEEVEDVTILEVLAEGNRLLLPVSQKDDNYPDGYAIIRPIKLNANSKVIVTSASEDGEIYYVLYNNSVGFMYASALSKSEDVPDLPFEDALVLHDNTYMYKYPLSTTSKLSPLYGFIQLEKDTKLTIENLANDYVCPMGMLWYRVEADVDGKTVVGYIPRYNVVQDAEGESVSYEYGRINAKLFEGYATVYADEGITELGTRIYDGAQVEIMAERGDYFYVREVEVSGDVATEGYVLKEVVTTDVQTRSFVIAIILIAVLVVVASVIVIIKIQLRKRRII